MDVWEANSISAAVTPHPCQATGLLRCEGTACGTNGRYDTVCDPDGCDFNSFRQGDKTFYGPGMTVDTTRKFTVVTQYITDNGAASGNLSEIRRLYVQDGNVIQNSIVNVPGMDAYDSITEDYCDAQKAAFGDTTQFQNRGGLTGMGAAMKRGMVLVLSVWDDHAVNMLWLDSDYPTDADPSQPGVARGTCATTSGVPSDVEANSANASVTYSNIRFGDIDSTYTGSSSGGGNGGTTTTQPSATTTTNASGATQTKWGQW
jgi:cellulose 1,4-beta-cellobiosidase